MCIHMYRNAHSVCIMWPMRAVEMFPPTSAASYKLITNLKARCNIRPACDHLPIESWSDVYWYLANRCCVTHVQKKKQHLKMTLNITNDVNDATPSVLNQFGFNHHL